MSLRDRDYMRGGPRRPIDGDEPEGGGPRRFRLVAIGVILALLALYALLRR